MKTNIALLFQHLNPSYQLFSSIYQCYKQQIIVNVLNDPYMYFKVITDYCFSFQKSHTLSLTCFMFSTNNKLQIESFKWISCTALCTCPQAQSLSCVRLLVTLGTVARQAPLSMGFSRQYYWSGLPTISSSRESSWPRDRTHVSHIGR